MPQPATTSTQFLTSKYGRATSAPPFHCLTALFFLALLAFTWQPSSSQYVILNTPLLNQPTPRPRKLIWPPEVSLGVILPYGFKHLPYMFEMVYPAIQEAVRKIEDNPQVLPGVKISLKAADSRCSDEYGPFAAIGMYLKRSVHAFLGPACGYAVAPVARYSYSWGIPILSAGVLYKEFTNKNEFRLLTSMQGNYLKSAGFVMAVLEHFNWNRTGFIFHQEVQLSGGLGGPLASEECLQIIRPIYTGLLFKYKVKNPYSTFYEKADVDWEKHLRLVAKGSRSEYNKPWLE